MTLPWRNGLELENMKISEVAAIVGCTPRAIRHYHQIGVLEEPPRLSNGYRNYRITDIAAIVRIRALIAAGIPIESASQTIDLHAALQSLDNRIQSLERQRAQLLRYLTEGFGIPEPIATKLRSTVPAAEFEMWELMAFSGITTEKTWQVVEQNLNNPHLVANTLRFYALWSDLSDSDFDEAALLIDDSIMKDIWQTFREGDLSFPAGALSLSPPQERFLTSMAAIMINRLGSS